MSTVSNGSLLVKSRSEAQKSKGYQRMAALFDEGSFNEIDAFLKSGDGLAEVVCGYGMVDECPAYAFVQNSDIAGGAMSKAQASKIRKVYDLAVKTGAPVIGVYDSIGGRLQEGSDMLAAYGDILRGANNLSGVVPQISVVLGPCVGTAAMIAASADIVIMAKTAELTVATSGKGGEADGAAKLGVCHVEAENEAEALKAARKLITVLPSNNLTGAPSTDALSINTKVAPVAGAGAKEIISAVTDDSSFIELRAKFGVAATVGFAQISGATVGFAAYEGDIDADACAKSARFVRFCDCFSVPVVTLVNAAQFQSLREAVKLSNAYSEATTAKVTVITGDAYGPVYIAVAGRGANADYTMAWTSAVVSPLAPETAAAFLWQDKLKGSADPVNDRKKLVEKYKETEASPMNAAAEGYIEDVINPEDTRARLIANLAMLSGKRVSSLPKKHSNIQI